MPITEIPLTPLVPWASTAAVQTVACPRCGSGIGFYCTTPGGRRAESTHRERTHAYLLDIGREEFNRRHTKTSLLP